MNIIFFDLIDLHYPGGFEKYCISLGNYFQSKKHNVTFVYSQQFTQFLKSFYNFLYRTKKTTEKEQKVENISLFNILLVSLLPFTKSFFSVRKFLLQADVIYAKNEFQELTFLYVLLGRKEYRKKVIIGVHSAIFIPSQIKGFWRFIHDLQYNSFFYTKFLQQAKCIHVPNEKYVSKIEKIYHVKKSSLIFIPNPIDWEVTLQKREKHSLLHVIWIGRLSLLKGVDRLEELIVLLAQKPFFANMQISIVSGGGEGERTIVGLVKKYPNIHYLSFMKDLSQLYQDGDLSLNTSYFETFGYTILESQSFGVPVISFPVDGALSIIEDGKTGYIVDTVNDFVNAIEKFYCIYIKKYDIVNSMREKTFLSTNKRFQKKTLYSHLETLFIKVKNENEK